MTRNNQVSMSKKSWLLLVFMNKFGIFHWNFYFSPTPKWKLKPGEQGPTGWVIHYSSFQVGSHLSINLKPINKECFKTSLALTLFSKPTTNDCTALAKLVCPISQLATKESSLRHLDIIPNSRLYRLGKMAFHVSIDHVIFCSA